MLMGNIKSTEVALRERDGSVHENKQVVADPQPELRKKPQHFVGTSPQSGWPRKHRHIPCRRLPLPRRRCWSGTGQAVSAARHVGKPHG